MAAGLVDTPPDGTKAEYGRRWLKGKKVSKQTYDAATGGAPSEQPAPAQVPAGNDALATFQNFMAALNGAAKSKEEQDAALRQIGNLVDTLDFKAHPDLLKNADVQKFIDLVSDARVSAPPADLPPGSPIGQGWAQEKKPWTTRDIWSDRGIPIVEYTPRETLTVIWNGEPCHFQEDVTVMVPKCFVDLAEDRRKQMRSAAEHAKYLFKSNYNPALLDPTMHGRPVDQQGFRTRAHITEGSFSANAGIALSAQDQSTLDMAAKLDGEGAEDGAEGGDAAA